MMPKAVVSPLNLKGDMTMKFEAINKKFTERVTEWLGKGYWINGGTMSGSQGEYAHVDFTNGTEFIRVLMEERCGYGKGDRVVVIVGRYTDRVKIGSSDRLGNTVWNQRLEVITEDSFYKIGHWSEWYGTEEEADAAQKKASDRYYARMNGEYKTKEFKGAEKIALKFARREITGCKTAKLSDVTKVEKVYNTDLNGKLRGVGYYVTVKGKRVKLA